MICMLALACDRRPLAPMPLESITPTLLAEAGNSRVRVDAEVEIVAVGDIMMHGMVKRSAAMAADEAGNHDGFDVLWEDLRADLSAADIAFANLETPVAPKARREVKQMVFDAPPVVLDSLAHAGFDVVSFANNHVYDQGIDGLVETVENIAASPLVSVGAGPSCGAAWAPSVVERNGIRVGFVATSDLFNANLNAGDDAPCVAVFDEAKVLASVVEAREAGVDLVVVSVHWGVEYSTTPLPRHVDAARRLIDGGVDVILGHHPHVIQPIEVRIAPDGRRGLIAYSLGNFVSNQVAFFVPGVHRASVGNPRDGLMLRFRAVRKDYGVLDGKRLLRTELASVEAVPLWTENNQTTRRAGDDVRIRTVRTPAALQAAVGRGESAKTSEERIHWLDRAETLSARVRGVGAIVGEHFLFD
jgi:hypothetical protein